MSLLTRLVSRVFGGSSMHSKSEVKSKQGQLGINSWKKFDIVKHPKFGRGRIDSLLRTGRDSMGVSFSEMPESKCKVRLSFYNHAPSPDRDINSLKYVCSREEEIKTKYGLDLAKFEPAELAGLLNNPTYEADQALREVVLDKLGEYEEKLPEEAIQKIKGVLEKGQYPSDHDICGFTSAIKTAGDSRNKEFISLLKNIFEEELEERSKETDTVKKSFDKKRVASLVLIEATTALTKIGTKSKDASSVLLGCLRSLIEKIDKEIEEHSIDEPYVETAKEIAKALREHTLFETAENNKKEAMAEYIDKQAGSLEELYGWFAGRPYISELETDLYRAEEMSRIKKIWQVVDNPKKYSLTEEQRGKLLDYVKRQKVLLDYLDNYDSFPAEILELRKGVSEVDEILQMVELKKD